ncbi:MAG TPA: TIGR03435 family protein [Terriglobia bacterium]|nr:TIGR03435 family protein [Terriglobia bacterium]
MSFRKSLPIIAGVVLAAIPFFAQSPDALSRKFDVVSVKPNKSGDGNVTFRLQPGGRFVATNATVRMLLRLAYLPMQDFQFVGGPNWLSTDHFDIQAQAEGALSQDENRVAVRAMLEDRFQLKTHREAREGPAYTLLVGKDGPKVKSVDAPLPPQRVAPPPPPGPGPIPASFTPPPGAVFRGNGNLIASAVPMSQIIDALAAILGRPVVDKTGLTGFFDVRLQFSPESASLAETGAPSLEQPVGNNPLIPSLFTAIQEQLGLRLEASKTLAEVLIIDSVQKPSEN